MPDHNHCSFGGSRLQRREVLRVGGLSGIALGLPQVLASRSAAAAESPRTFGRAKQVIALYLHGGHPQQETFDPKPDGPSAVRGEFGAISTSVPGVLFSELLPRSAAWMHQLAVIRSMSHDITNHVQASMPTNTGHRHPPSESRRGDFPPSETDFPPFGAVLNALRPAEQLPTWVRIGELMRRSNGTPLHGQLPGFLGARHSSFVVDQKLTGGDVKIEAVRRLDELSAVRLQARRELLGQFDQHRQLIDAAVREHPVGAFYARAFDLLTSPRIRNAFELADESPALRERYGMTEFGQRCLLARRLAEAGVPMVNVSYCHTPSGSWDTHGQNFKKMKDSLAPTFDAAFSALLEDMQARGLLEETLVIVMAEFGRTPAINKNAGRDHWPWVYSEVLAGAGIRPGTVFGASDASAAYPLTEPRGPNDFAATIYHLLGIEPSTVVSDQLNRPHQLIAGNVITELLG